jgi:asparagine N-glycosylation enzyme membrane subunit Stt3
LNVVTISSRIVEPLIAASIVVVCIENFLRRNALADRLWLAGFFGLIHGFGFAGALRETGLGQSGASIALPLFSFNLGVEAGQLAVAAVVLPALLLMYRWQRFARYGVPAISAAVMLVSGYWLLERTFLFQ